MGIQSLSPKALETLVQSIHTAVNASNKEYGVSALPNLTDKCDPAYIQEIVSRLDNLGDVLQIEALKAGLETGKLPDAYDKVLTNMLNELQDCQVEGMPKDVAGLLEAPFKDKTVRSALLEVINSRDKPIQPYEMRNLLWKPLVETFVIPQYKIIPKEDMEQWGKDNYGSYLQGLNEDQKECIVYYKDVGYKPINSYLRGISEGLTPKATKNLPILQTIYLNTPSNNDNVVLYHGDWTQQWFNNAIGNQEWSSAEGMTFTLDKGFLSTSLDKECANVFVEKTKKNKDKEGTPITYTILYPKGTKSALFLDGLEHKHATERELLFKPQAKFKVLTTDASKGEVTLLALNS